MYLRAKTLDDLLRAVLAKLLTTRNRVTPTRGAATEFIGVLLELTNPRARLSRTETKGRLFSSLGELLWYLAGSKNVNFISYYVSRYRAESDDGRTVHGGYGPRFFGMRGHNQVRNVLRLLKKRRSSRRAVIQLFDAADISRKHKEIPCTCTLQFMIRRGRLHMVTHMRSNDAFVGLPHDVFAFTMLQEIFARTLGVELGSYRHAVGSLHLYKRDRANARDYLKEGWQATIAMPRMPRGNPWPQLRKLVRAEAAIRSGKSVRLGAFDSYWGDLARLLMIYRRFKDRNSVSIVRLKREMAARIYDPYIEDKRVGAGIAG